LTLSLSALLVAGCVLLTWIAGRRVAALQSLTQARSRRWQQANTAVLLAGLILLAGTAAIALMNSSLPEPRTSWHPVEDSFWLIAGSSVVFILSASLSALIRRTRKAPAFTSI
jgi:small neutral amino acid transporter SnatA (MarC family)